MKVINELLPVLTSGNTGVWVCEPSAGVMDFKNDFFGILGLTRWGINFSSLDELRALIHADDLPIFEQAFAAASAGKTASATYRCCAGGKQMPLASSLIPCDNGVFACTLNKDPMMQPDYLEKQYKTLVNSLFPNFIFVFDDNFFFVDIITPDGLRLFHNNEDLIGTDARNLYSPEVSELFITNIQECLKNNTWREIEFPIDLFGTTYFYQVRLVPVEDNKVLCLNIDIGDRVRRMDELLTQRHRAEESDKMKSVFIANMDQKIKSPLDAIITSSGHLRMAENTEEKQKHLDVIRKNSDLLLHIINDIIDLSRKEAGMSEFQTKENIGSMREFAANQRKKVLLAETSKEDLQFINNTLTQKYDVVEVTDAENIITAFILENPNLVIINLEMDGNMDIIRKIRAISTTIPIIAMTTSDFYHDQRRAIENGCSDAIPKPFSTSKIEEIVMAYIV